MCHSTCTLVNASQTMKLTLWIGINVLLDDGPASSSATPLASTPMLVITITGAISRSGVGGGPLRRYSALPV